ncbi:MAG: hypothetical protein KQA40_01780 [Candidatus Aenigmarchaeota archaeon]|nr:hypothetical protein [Candidatus Aenigmarchaeota archaeon]
MSQAVLKKYVIILLFILLFPVSVFAAPFNPDFGVSDLFLALFSIVISSIIPGASEELEFITNFIEGLKNR